VIIWLSGPTGAGKTSLGRGLRKNGYSIVEENIPEDLLRAFAIDPIPNCETLQRHLMQARLDGWRKVEAAPRIAFDRSIDEDLEVFCRMHRKAGLLTDSQFASLAEFGRDLQNQIPAPDLIVFVTSDPAILSARIQDSNAPPAVSENLGCQISLYSEWLEHRTEEVLKWDTSRLSEKTMSRLLLEIQSC
jgi:deoxyadenosine/deoxycytidine kinase